jgi:hypothetical protein
LCWAHFDTAPNDGRANLPVFWLERLPQLLRFWQEVYDETGGLIEIHEKFPVDKGHQKV